MIRAVFLDLDDTLFDYKGYVSGSEAYLYEMAAEALKIPVRSCRAAYLKTRQDLYRSKPLDPSIFDLRQRISGLLGRVGRRHDEALAERLFTSFSDRFLSIIQPYPDTRPALEEVRKLGRSAAIVSNGIRDQQTSKVRSLGLDDLVDVQVYSEDVGVNKPEPAIFHRALDQLGASPGQCLMVGDICSVDVKGARRAGIHSCWLRRGPFARMHPRDASEAPDFTITGLAEIPRIVLSL